MSEAAVLSVFILSQVSRLFVLESHAPEQKIGYLVFSFFYRADLRTYVVFEFLGESDLFSDFRICRREDIFC